MHILDGFLPLDQSVVYWIVTILFIVLSLRWARHEMSEEKIPLIAVLSAGIFAIQLVNVPVGLGASGHMIGAALAAIVLGSPFAAVFILTLVLVLQGVLFADGGITTMGANILNMGVVGGFVGYYTFKGLVRAIKNWPVAAFIAAFLSALIPAAAVVLELFVAGTLPYEIGLVIIGLYTLGSGLVEGIITVIALRFIADVRPDIVPVGGTVVA